MIADLSRSLRALLNQPGVPPALAAAVVVFDRPSEPFAPTQSTLDLFLYDIRENRDLAPRASDGVASRVLTCSYLITAWPVGGAELALQEQELLAAALLVLTAHPAIPADLLQGQLVGRPSPQVLMMHPDAAQSTAEFWSSVGNKLRPSLTLTATLSVPVPPAQS
jgi:hypothetical protein